MKNLLATVLFSAFSILSFSQKSPIKFGDVSIEDLKVAQYEGDTSAAAVILCDYGETEFQYTDTKGWQLQFDRIVRIKIFSNSGYRWADFSIPLYRENSNKEKLAGLKAVTYNLENGKVVETKLKGDATFEDKSSEYFNQIKFTLPNVKEGSVIEVKYSIVSDFIYNFQDWEFQSLIPTKWSEYRATFPEFFDYERYMQGYVPLTVNESKPVDQSFTIGYTTMPELGKKPERGTYALPSKSTTSRWAAENVPAFKEEPFLTNYRDYISKINFELAYVKYPNKPVEPVMGTWAQLNASFLENELFGRAVGGSGFLKDKAEELTAGLTTPQEKIASISNYVKSTVEWDGRYRKFLDDNLKKPIEEKKGSAAEINLLLVSLLQKAGLVANPVIISTCDHGFVRENVPVSAQFNYVICQAVVDGKSLLLDATDRLLPVNALPEVCINGRGYIISKDTPGWINLSSPKSRINATAEVSLTAEGQLKGKMKISHDGYYGSSMRKKYLKNGEEEYVKELAHKMSWDLGKMEFENIKNLQEAAKENYEFTHQDSFGNAPVIYINPLLYLRENENPFKLEDRKYPVDFGRTFDQTYMGKFIVPDNYQIEELPVSKVIALPNNAGRYTFSVAAVGNVINVTSILAINQSLFNQNDYPYLREFFTQVVAKQAEQIVLKKK